MANERLNYVWLIDVLVVHRDLSQDELGHVFNLGDVQNETDVHDDEDNVALLEVEINSSLVSNHSARRVYNVHGPRMQILVLRLDRTERFETELRTLVHNIVVLKLVAEQVSEQLCLSGLRVSNEKHIASLRILVAYVNHVHFFLASHIEFDAGVSGDILSHFLIITYIYKAPIHNY